MIEFSQDDEQINITARVFDEDGDETTFTEPNWMLSGNSIIQADNVTPDGKTITLGHVAPHLSGVTALTFTCKGKGGNTISFTDDVVVSPGNGVSIQFEVG